MSVKDIIIDGMPAPIYRVCSRLRDKRKEHRWNKQRNSGTLPECDLWDYKNTLADNIYQGLSYLTREMGATDWQADREHRKKYKDLLEAKRTFGEIKFYLENWVIICNTEEEAAKKSNGAVFYVSQKEYEEFEKRKSRAFRILDKYFWGLWD